MARLQSSDALGQHHDTFSEVEQESSRPNSPWLNTADAAFHLRYTGKHPLRSVYKFIARHGIVTRHDGRRLLLARADVDRALKLGKR